MELIIAANDGDIIRVRELLDAGINPNITDYDGDTPLVYASEEGYTEIVKLLLDSGADADPNLQEQGRYTPLIVSSDNDYDIVKLLLENGADPNIQNHEGYTPLIWATIMGCNDIVKLLLENGADPNISDRWGDTAYDLAILGGQFNIAKLLKYYMMMYKIQRRRRRNLTYRKKRTQLAYKNLALSKLFDTYDVDEPLTRHMRRETIRSIFG